MMKLFEHKFAIALVLSGLVHSSLMFSSFYQVVSFQLPIAEMDSLHVELLSQSASDDQPYTEKSIAPEAVKSITTIAEKPVARSKPVAVAKPVSEAEIDEKPVVAEVSYQQVRQTSQTMENENQLIQLVYEAINRHKRYPYKARRLGQQGKVSLNFVMHPDGQVTDLIVTTSSQYAVLDMAAKEAVAAISPFAMAIEYLSNEKAFDVSVDFQLN